MRSRRPSRIRALRCGLLAAVLSIAAFSASASAAELQADFHFNDTRTAPTGEAIADIGTGNAFVATAVDAAASERQVLAFPLGNGLSLPTAGLAESGSYTVVMLFRLDSTSGRRKLLDFAGGSSDAGLYLCDGRLLIELAAATPCPTFPEVGSEWTQVALTRDGSTGAVRAYLGSDQPTAIDVGDAMALPSQLRLFKDDDLVPADEHSGGSVARIRMYDGVLSEAEIEALDRVDTSAPPVALHALPSLTNDRTPTFSGAAGSEAGDLGQVTVKVYSGATASGPPVATAMVSRAGDSWTLTPSTPLDDGTYTAQAEQADGAGNRGESVPRTFALDASAAAVSLDTPVDATRDATPTYSGAAGNAAGDSETVTVEVYAGPSASGTPVQTLTTARSGASWSVAGSPGLADGTYTARAEQADEAGNKGVSDARTFTVDTVAPAVSLDTPAAGSAMSDSTPTYSGQAGDAPADSGTVTVKVYAGSSASGTPIRTLTAARSGANWSVEGSPGLADGTYTVRAEQADAAGNVGASGARTFTVDTVGPGVGLVTPAASSSINDSTPTYSGAAGDAAGDSNNVTVRIYSGSSASGTPVQTVTTTRSGTSWSVVGSSALGDGTYTARAAQADSAGNVEFSVPTTFTVDTVLPGVSLTSPSGGVTSDRTPTYSGAAGVAPGDSPTVRVEIYDGPAGVGAPVQTLTAPRSGSSWSTEGSPPLADGTYTAMAEQVDTAGNTGQSELRTFTVDGAGPSVSLETPAAGSAGNDNTPTYSGAAGDAPGDLETVTLRVYSGPAADGVPVQTLTVPRAGATWSKAGSPALPDGTHTAQAAQWDSAGNVNVSEPRTFLVDTARPDTIVTSAPPNPTNDSTPVFTFSSLDGDRFVCRLYRANSASAPAFGDCASPRATAPLGDDSYVFQVAAVDTAGNQDDSPASRTFRVDTIAPRTAISLAPGDTIARDAVFAFAAHEAAHFSCRVDTGPWGSCGSPRSYSGLALGPHIFEVRASDAAGNQGGSARHEWQVLRPGATIPAAGRQAVALAQDMVDLRKALKRVPLARAARRGAIAVRSLNALTAGTFRLVTRARGARFASGRRQVSAAGSYRLKLELTKRGRRLARRVPKLRIDLKLAFTDGAGRALQANTAVTMLRKPSKSR